MRSLIFLACLSLSLVLAGCGTPPEERLEAPALQVKSLAATGSGYALELQFINPNTVPLVIGRSTHTVSLGDTRIGRIDDTDPIGVPPLGGVNHIVAITGKSAAEVRAWLASKTAKIPVHVESALTVSVRDNDKITLKTSGGGSIKAP